MKRIALLFVMLLALSACGAEQTSGFSRAGSSSQAKNAARLERQLERQQARLRRQKVARVTARIERQREARQLARAATRQEARESAQEQTLVAAPDASCDYDPCLPPAPDYDCAGGSGDGPAYTGYVRVLGADPYDLDSDGDGVGCES